MIDLAALTEQAGDLTPLPTSAVRLLELAANPNRDLTELVEVIVYDQVLTMKLLRAANSVISAAAMPVGSVQEALIRMGTAEVLTLAVASGARPIMEKSIAGYGLGEGALWRHSVAAAIGAESMQVFADVNWPSEAFTAALLHDVGKIVMGRFLSPLVIGFLKRAEDTDHLSPMEAESLLLGVHHGQIGGLIAQHWNMPPRIVQGIIHHHNPDQALDIICDCTYAANQIAKFIDASLENRKFNLAIPLDVAGRLGVTPDRLQQLGPVALKRFTDLSGRYYAV